MSSNTFKVSFFTSESPVHLHWPWRQCWDMDSIFFIHLSSHYLLIYAFILKEKRDFGVMECWVLIHLTTLLFIWLCYLGQFIYPPWTSEKRWGKRFERKPLNKTTWNVSGENTEDMIVQKKTLGDLVHPLMIWMGKLRPRQWFGFYLQGLDPKAGSQADTEGKLQPHHPAEEIRPKQKWHSPGTPYRSCGSLPISHG